LTVRSEPAPPFRGERAMFPVVSPPTVKVLLRTLWREPSPFRYIPLVASVPEVAETEATGVAVPLMLRTANLALWVDCPPMRRSTVELFGVRNPAPSVQFVEPVPAWSALQTNCPLPLSVSLSVPEQV